jgi:hypothetical protein
MRESRRSIIPLQVIADHPLRVASKRLGVQGEETPDIGPGGQFIVRLLFDIL